MTAPNHPTGTPLPLFSPAWGEALQQRLRQVELGHDAAQDDRTGPYRLTVLALHKVQAASDQLLGHPDRLRERLDKDSRRVVRRRLTAAMALLAAAIDTIDRIPEPD